jgi:hypothetical protein
MVSIRYTQFSVLRYIEEVAVQSRCDLAALDQKKKEMTMGRSGEIARGKI